jgi:hypothetical protein
MFERIHQKLGTAGFIISIVALVAALSGGAYAATNNGGAKATASAKAKQGKQGKPGKTGPAGPQGPAGSAGAKGDTGAAGSNGTNGAPGANGTSVTSTAFTGEEEPESEPCEEQGGTELKSASGVTYACNGKEGSPWTAGGTLPKGKTETGVWSFGNTAKPAAVPVSFNIPLPGEVIEKVVAEGEPPTTSCPGTATEPKAAQGFFCVYVAEILPAGTATVFAHPVGLGTVGFSLNVFTSEPSFAEGGLGTWAVTAG